LESLPPKRRKVVMKYFELTREADQQNGGGTKP
jgi:hypothetical protein